MKSSSAITRLTDNVQTKHRVFLALLHQNYNGYAQAAMKTIASSVLISAFLFALVQLGREYHLFQERKYAELQAAAGQERQENAGNYTAQPESIFPSLFLAKQPELQHLIHAHEQQSNNLNETARLLTRIIQDPKYYLHTPNSSILFIKTHKTGSSTICSILHSIVTAHKDLTTAVTKKGEYSFLGDRKTILQLPTNQQDQTGAPFDVWTNHIDFDDYLLTNLVKTNDRYFSILRDPGTRHRSGAGYTTRCTLGTKGVINYATWTQWVLNNDTERFGFHCMPDFATMQVVGSFPNDDHFQQQREVAYERAKNGKLLLLVVERMSESLLLLWDYYQLHPLDVTFFSMKVNKEQSTETKEGLEALQRVREWNPEDVKMYQFATDLLDQLVQKIFPGSTLQQAIKERQQLNDIVSEVCFDVLGKDPRMIDNGMVRVDYSVLARRAANHPLLGYWCLEKRLDNWEWNRFHVQRVKSTDTIDYYDNRPNLKKPRKNKL